MFHGKTPKSRPYGPAQGRLEPVPAGRASPGPAGASPGRLEAARTIRVPKIWIWPVETEPLGKKIQNHRKFPPRDQWGGLINGGD